MASVNPKKNLVLNPTTSMYGGCVEYYVSLECGVKRFHYYILLQERTEDW
jgi:hypothetical protein